MGDDLLAGRPSSLGGRLGALGLENTVVLDISGAKKVHFTKSVLATELGSMDSSKHLRIRILKLIFGMP